MSLDYCMYLQGIQLQNALHLLLKLPQFVELSKGPNPRDGNKMTYEIKGPGILMYLSEINYNSDEEKGWEPFISKPDISFFLTANKFTDPVKVDQGIASIVRELLLNSKGDAIFYFTQSSRLLLQRQNGSIFIDNELDNFWRWDESILKTFGLKCTLKTLPEV